MRVAIVIHSMGSGGAERVSGHLANFWRNSGAEVHLITVASRDSDFYNVNIDVKRHSLGLEGSSANSLQALAVNFNRVWALRAVLKDIRPDVVIGMMTGSAVTALLASRGLKMKVIVSERVHPPSYPLGQIWEWLRKKTYRWADRVIMQTDESQRWLRRYIPQAYGSVIPNPVIYPLPAGEPVIALGDCGCVGQKILLAVGRLAPQKGFDSLIEAFSQLAKKHADWNLVILGEGPEREQLQDIIVRLGLAGRVQLPGRAGNLGDWYARADLYVMSSRFEGFPNTLAEAMAHGCAAVSYDCDTGPRDIIRHEVDGLLVRPVGDVLALAETLDRLMGDSKWRKEMGSKAIEVRERFSTEKIFGLWQSVVGGNK